MPFSTLGNLALRASPNPVLLNTEVNLLYNATHASQLSPSWCLCHLGHQPVPSHLSDW